MKDFSLKPQQVFYNLYTAGSEITMALSLAQGSRLAPITVAPTPTPTQELPVEQDGVPIGENATRFATWLGIQIRMAAPLKNVEKWDDIPFHVKAPIIQATRDKFNIVGYDEKEHVRHGVDRKCKKLFRTWRHNMKDHYEALVEAGKDPYVNPYKGVSGEDWAWMIGNIWTNKEKEQLAADLFYFAAKLNCSEKINAYDEKFARFEAVMSAYMHGNPIGAGSNCHLLEIMFLDRAW
ncbi:hypothetical protein RHGRI_004295 [Rhododendron griersonianum]|uniref:Uncharacterized protein n=1 Tax=Rhododendron griersonianum TaxID=479676 RepID=A0AAV6LB22_9ERIC|nr:hypothetical protein RHGRI_004295 [Rhododendron griersonianum]